MDNVQIFAVCLSCILGACGVATIFVSGWVKASHISELKGEIDKLWERVIKVTVLETKIESIEKGISEIKEMLRK